MIYLLFLKVLSNKAKTISKIQIINKLRKKILCKYIYINNIFIINKTTNKQK